MERAHLINEHNSTYTTNSRTAPQKTTRRQKFRRILNYCIFRHKTGIFYRGAISYAPPWAIFLSFITFALMIYQVVVLIKSIGTPTRVSNQELDLDEAGAIYAMEAPDEDLLPIRLQLTMYNESFWDNTTQLVNVTASRVQQDVSSDGCKPINDYCEITYYPNQDNQELFYNNLTSFGTVFITVHIQIHEELFEHISEYEIRYIYNNTSVALEDKD